jgi:hypothetical protein
MEKETTTSFLLLFLSTIFSLCSLCSLWWTLFFAVVFAFSLSVLGGLCGKKKRGQRPKRHNGHG